jgi:hypothetical protein
VLPPYAPSGLALASHYQVINLSWTAPAGAVSYTLGRSTSSTGPFTALATGLTTTNFIDTGLINGTTYYYELNAVNPSGQSGYSVLSQTPTLVVPQTPSNFAIMSIGAK